MGFFTSQMIVWEIVCIMCWVER